jgi:hypothetical protein
MKKSTLLCLVFFMLTCICSFAQSSERTSVANKNTIEGTYQIQVINTRDNPFIPGNLEELVLKNRDADKRIFIQLGTQVRLMILPETEIKSKDFKPIQKIDYLPQ